MMLPAASHSLCGARLLSPCGVLFRVLLGILLGMCCAGCKREPRSNTSFSVESSPVVKLREHNEHNGHNGLQANEPSRHHFAQSQLTDARLMQAKDIAADIESGFAVTDMSQSVDSREVPTVMTNQVPPAPDGGFRELTWQFKLAGVGDMYAVVVVPHHANANRRLPVLVTMHGLGESMKGPKRGARGWIDDYWLPRALNKLVKPPIQPSDFRGQFDRKRLDQLNAGLTSNPYKGMIVVCPYTPVELLQGEKAYHGASVLADFIVDTLLKRVYEQTPAIGSVQTTGLDGVSLGGRAALLVGLARPEAFRVVGALQPAFDVSETGRVTARAVEARKKNPQLIIRLLTSQNDYYLKSTQAISAAFTRAQVTNSLVVIPGDHSYEFNRGPGVFEMLILHDKELWAAANQPFSKPSADKAQNQAQ